MKSSPILKNAKLALTAAFMLAAAGILSVLTMPRMEDPEIPDRQAILVMVYPGADPEMVQRLVAEPVEERLAEIEEIDEISSTIRAETLVTEIILLDRLEDEIEIEDVWSEVRRALDDARVELPNGVMPPVLNTKLLETEAVLLAVTGAGDPLALMAAAEKVKKSLLNLPSVEKVLVTADPGDQITIEYDDALARRLGVGPAQLTEQLRARTPTTPGGSIHVGGRTAILRPFAEFTTVSEVQRTPIVLPSGAAVPLGQLADVRRGPVEPEVERMRLDGARAVGLGVVARSATNLVTFGDQVAERLSSLREAVAPIEIREVTFQPRRVSSRLNDLGRSLLLGILIVAAVLILAMGPRLGLIVAAIVPLVAASAVALYNAGGGILQQMSIAALVIALGLLVDNAIVVAEAVQQYVDEGLTGAAAAAKAVGELWLPLLAATGTTLAAFIPMLLAEGGVGSFTRAIPQVIMLTLTASYFFAVFVTPVLAARFLRPSQSKAAPETPIMQKRPRWTQRLAALSVGRPKTVAAAILVVLALALAHLPMVRLQFFPASDRNQLLVSLELPEGSHLDATDDASRQLEIKLSQHRGVESVAAFVGRSTPQFYYNLPRRPRSPHLAQMLVTTHSAAAVEPLGREIRAWASNELPGVVVSTRWMEQGPPIDAAIEIHLFADDPATLDDAAGTTLAALRTIPGVASPRHDVGQGLPSIRFAVDDASAGRFALARAHVAQALVGQTRGLVAGYMRHADDPVPIVVRAAAGERLPAPRLASIDVGGAVPLSQVARFEPEWLPAVIHHKDRERLVTVSADVEAGTTYSEVLSKLRPRLAEELPPTMRWEVGGADEASKISNQAIGSKMPYTMLLLFFILLAEFRSYRRVGLILLTIPLAAVGVIPGLAWSGQPFGFMSLLGVLALSGIVVNNAIVLLEVIEARREEGATVAEAVADGVARRARPILLTTATTVLGLMPLAFSSASLWPPLAWAMISGLLTSTALTLLAVPALYRILFHDPINAGVGVVEVAS